MFLGSDPVKSLLKAVDKMTDEIGQRTLFSVVAERVIHDVMSCNEDAGSCKYINLPDDEEVGVE